MVASEYYQKQIELLPPWILATTNPDVKPRLLDGAVDLRRQCRHSFYSAKSQGRFLALDGAPSVRIDLNDALFI
jgi:hypothetical protein